MKIILKETLCALAKKGGTLNIFLRNKVSTGFFKVEIRKLELLCLFYIGKKRINCRIDLEIEHYFLIDLWCYLCLGCVMMGLSVFRFIFFLIFVFWLKSSLLSHFIIPSSLCNIAKEMINEFLPTFCKMLFLF